MPLAAIYIFNHGAMTTYTDKDPDGMMFEEVRKVVGSVPIIATLDLHANVSPRMVDSVDLLIPYYTNPHVDQFERGAEAARFMKQMLSETDRLVLSKNCERLPLIIPSVCLLTTDAGPFARWMAFAHQEKGIDVPVVGLIPGFAWSDTNYNGFIILTYGNQKTDSTNRAKKLAKTIADKVWNERNQISVKLTSLKKAAKLALQAQAESALPVCFADVADNPGGGGSGRVLDILRTLLAAGASRVLMGLFHIPDLAKNCHELGVGASLPYTFDSDTNHPFTKEVSVLALSDGIFVGRRGLIAGRCINLSLCAAIKIEGITMVVTTRRTQAADPTYFESFGLRIEDYATVVLKSRGHFRAGFDEFFKPRQIFEVDASGLTSPLLSRFDFKYLPPAYLDGQATWPLST